MEVIGDGEVLRAGVRARSSCSRRRSTSSSSERWAGARCGWPNYAGAGLPAQTTLRGHLLGLGALGVVGKREAGTSLRGRERADPGGAGVDGVAERSRLAEHAPRGALVRDRLGERRRSRPSSTVGARLSSAPWRRQPMSLTELDSVIPTLSYPALERRLSSMRMAGLVEAAPRMAPAPPTRSPTGPGRASSRSPPPAAASRSGWRGWRRR